jgi:Phage integrase family
VYLADRPWEPDALVFGAPEGGPLRHRNFYRRRFRPAVADAGLPERTRFHDLRHTCAALLIAQGAHPLAVMQRLGHSSITVTMNTYGHLFPELDEALTEGRCRLQGRARRESRFGSGTTVARRPSRGRRRGRYAGQKHRLTCSFLGGRGRRRSVDPTLFRRVLCRLSYPAVSGLRLQPARRS